MFEDQLARARFLLPRIAVVLLCAVALASLASAIAALLRALDDANEVIAAVFALIVMALHLAVAALVWRRSRRTVNRWAIGCFTYLLTLFVVLNDVSGGLYVVNHRESDPVPYFLLGPVLIFTAPAALLALFTAPSEFD